MAGRSLFRFLVYFPTAPGLRFREHSASRPETGASGGEEKEASEGSAFAERPEDFELAAVGSLPSSNFEEAFALEHVFASMQNGVAAGGSWAEQPSFRVCTDRPRSMSVGDVIVLPGSFDTWKLRLGGGREEGRAAADPKTQANAFMAAGVGFEPIGSFDGPGEPASEPEPFRKLEGGRPRQPRQQEPPQLG